MIVYGGYDDNMNFVDTVEKFDLSNLGMAFVSSTQFEQGFFELQIDPTRSQLDIYFDSFEPGESYSIIHSKHPTDCASNNLDSAYLTRMKTQRVAYELIITTDFKPKMVSKFTKVEPRKGSQF